MSQSHENLIAGLYAAFGRGDVAGVLSGIGEEIEWHSPQNLPHGGDFNGRDAVGRFFQGIGEHWESLEVDLEDLLSRDDRVVAIARAHGRLKPTGEEFEYSAVHVWRLSGDTPVRFDEYVNAPVLQRAGHVAAG
jgi:uncharacterized protein